MTRDMISKSMDKNKTLIYHCQFRTLQAGGPSYTVELGRFDGLVSRSSDVNGRLPQPSFNLNQLNTLFANNGLTQTDMIALSGNCRRPPF